jgi:hypothetical protein
MFPHRSFMYCAASKQNTTIYGLHKQIQDFNNKRTLLCKCHTQFLMFNKSAQQECNRISVLHSQYLVEDLNIHIL